MNELANCTSAAMTISNNCATAGSWWTYQPYYYPPTTQYIYTSTPWPYPDLQIRKVEGGWVVTVAGKEHVITKPEQVLKFLKEG